MAREIIEFDYEIVHDEIYIPVRVEAEIFFYEDLNFGADADGDRGTQRTLIEDVEIGSIQNEDGNQVILEEKEMENIRDRAKTVFLEG
jgi:hypothetical protein